MSDDLLIRRDGALTRFTFNRPEKRNALSAGLVEALLHGIEAAGRDGTRLAVFQGAGKGFCAGFDFTGIETQSDADLVHRFVRVEQMLQAIRHAPFATLALVHGACFGAAADIVAACSRRVAVPGATFRMPGLRFGVVLGTRRLADLIGPDRARSLLETTRVFTAEEARDLGFLTDIVAEDAWPGLVERTLAAAETLPSAAQRALLERTTPDTRDADMAALVRSVATPGLRARIAAFLDETKKKG